MGLGTKSKESKANIVAVWVDIDVEGVTDQNGDPITSANAGIDKTTGLPTIIPKKASEFIDENGNGRQDEDEPTIEYEFKRWGRDSYQANEIYMPVKPIFDRIISATVYFDFNAGFPSTILNGTNPASLETNDVWETGAYEHYYQKKKILLSHYQGSTYKGVVKDNKDANASIDKVSIPVRENYTFIGWSPFGHNTPNQTVIYYPNDIHEIYYDITTQRFSYANARDQEKLVYYAQWKQNKPETVKLKAMFDFNGGIPTIDGTTLSSPNQTWNCSGNQHYYEVKSVSGTLIGGSLYSVSVSDDKNANAFVDNVSIPARADFIFKGWSLQHDGAVVLYYPSDVYTYTFDANNSLANNVVFYAIWEKKDSELPDRNKYLIHFIEDVNDANTGDNDYYTNNQTEVSFATNPSDGVFYQMSVASGVVISEPNTTPASVTINGTVYNFDYWSLNPNAPNDFFSGTVTAVDLTNVTVVAPNVVLAKLYAIYKAEGVVSPDNATKATIYYVEDIADFNTGDGTYYADIMHQQYSSNILDGYFYKVTGVFGASPVVPTPIYIPNSTPNGGMFLGNEYQFSYWTLDPTSPSPTDFFATNPNATFNDVFMNAQYSNETAYLYAVYKSKTQSKEVQRLFRDISNNSIEDKFSLERGKYIVSIICNGYDQGNGTTPAGEITINVKNSQGAIVSTVSPTPLRAMTYGTYFYSDIFTVDAGDYVTLNYSVSTTAGGDQGSNIITIYRIS